MASQSLTAIVRIMTLNETAKANTYRINKIKPLLKGFLVELTTLDRVWSLNTEGRLLVLIALFDLTCVCSSLMSHL